MDFEWFERVHLLMEIIHKSAVMGPNFSWCGIAATEALLMLKQPPEEMLPAEEPIPPPRPRYQLPEEDNG